MHWCRFRNLSFEQSLFSHYSSSSLMEIFLQSGYQHGRGMRFAGKWTRWWRADVSTNICVLTIFSSNLPNCRSNFPSCCLSWCIFFFFSIPVGVLIHTPRREPTKIIFFCCYCTIYYHRQSSYSDILNIFMQRKHDYCWSWESLHVYEAYTYVAHVLSGLSLPHVTLSFVGRALFLQSTRTSPRQEKRRQTDSVLGRTESRASTVHENSPSSS